MFLTARSLFAWDRKSRSCCLMCQRIYIDRPQQAAVYSSPPLPARPLTTYTLRVLWSLRSWTFRLPLRSKTVKSSLLQRLLSYLMPLAIMPTSLPPQPPLPYNYPLHVPWCGYGTTCSSMPDFLTLIDLRLQCNLPPLVSIPVSGLSRICVCFRIYCL